MATDTMVGWIVLAIVVIVGIVWVIIENIVGSKHERELRNKKTNTRISKTKRNKYWNQKKWGL